MSKLYFRYAAMNAGKSTALLQAAYNYEERGMQVRLFTAGFDDRSGTGHIGSRLGISRPVETFDAATSFAADRFTEPDRPACIFVDEAQFLSPRQVQHLHLLAHTEDIPVICYGLRSDFQGHAFPGAAELLTLADDLEEMKTICACSRKASMNVRIDEAGQRVKAGDQVLIGGNAQYRAVCPACFYRDT